MKKIIFIITLFLSSAFIGCGDDDGTTLRWENQSGSDIKDIVWVDNNGNDNQWWDGITEDTKRTTYKEITKLDGEVDGVDELGDPTLILGLQASGSSGYKSISDGSPNATIEKNADATIVIGFAKKK